MNQNLACSISRELVCFSGRQADLPNRNADPWKGVCHRGAITLADRKRTYPTGMRIGQKYYLGPRISFDLASVQTLMSCRWAMWSFASDSRSRTLVAFVWLEVLVEKMARGVLSAVLMSPTRFPPALLVKRNR